MGEGSRVRVLERAEVRERAWLFFRTWKLPKPE
jgi:hypothetical protein